MDDVYEKNVVAIARFFPREVKRILDAPDLAGELTRTRSGDWTVARPTPAGETVLLHSRYDPRKEAQRLVDRLDLGPTDTVVLLGAGLGYVVEALFQRGSPEISVVAVEADPALSRAAFSRCDFSDVLEAGRFTVFTPSCAADVLELVSANLDLFFGGNLALLDHEPSRRLAGEYYARVRRWFSSAIEHGRVVLQTQLVLPTRQFDNLMDNVADYVTSGGVADYAGVHAGTPGILVAAGPSLAGNLPVLQRLRERAVTMVVSTALRPVVGAGMAPAYANLLDFHAVSARYFEDLDLRAPLFVDPLAASEAVRAYRGPKVFKDDPVINHVLGLPENCKGDVDAGGSVAHMALSLLAHMGCEPIILVGLDLSYSQGVTHAPGSAFFRQWRALVSPVCTFDALEWETLMRMRHSLTTAPDVHGGEVYTKEEFRTYVKELEVLVRRLARGGCRVFNATVGGARIEGAEPVSLDEVARAIEESGAVFHPRPALGLSSEQKAANLRRAVETLGERRADMDRAAREYERVVALAEESLEILDTGDIPRAKALRERMDEHRETAHGFGRAQSMLVTMSRADEFNRVRRQREIHALGYEGAGLLRAQAERDHDFYRGLLSCHAVLDRAAKRAMAHCEKMIKESAVATTENATTDGA